MNDAKAMRDAICEELAGGSWDFIPLDTEYATQFAIRDTDDDTFWIVSVTRAELRSVVIDQPSQTDGLTDH